MEGGGLVFGGRRGKERLSVGGEVLAAVGGVEAFGEDDEVGACFGGFEDASAGARKVGSFVGAWGRMGISRGRGKKGGTWGGTCG